VHQLKTDFYFGGVFMLHKIFKDKLPGLFHTGIFIFISALICFLHTVSVFANGYVYPCHEGREAGWYYDGDGEWGRLWPFGDPEGEELYSIIFSFQKDRKHETQFRKEATRENYFNWYYRNGILYDADGEPLFNKLDIRNSDFKTEGSVPFAVKVFIAWKLLPEDVRRDRKNERLASAREAKEACERKKDEKKETEALEKQQCRQWRLSRRESPYKNVLNSRERTEFKAWLDAGNYDPDRQVPDLPTPSNENLKNQQRRQWRESRGENPYKGIKNPQERVEFEIWIGEGNYDPNKHMRDPEPGKAKKANKEEDCSVA
jgi:hypothetical protein